MKQFARLYDELDRTTSTNAKVAALVSYLAQAPPDDAAWALFFLTGRRLKRHLPSRLLHQWTLEFARLPEWLVDESYALVGDFAEAIALLVEPRGQPISVAELQQSAARDGRLPFDEAGEVDERVEDISLTTWIRDRILPLREMSDDEKRVRVLTWWSRLKRNELFLLTKLLTGEFRVGVSHALVVRAVAQHAGLPTPVVEHRLMGSWEPSGSMFEALIAPEDPGGDPSRPYPFFLASPLDHPLDTLGAREEWLAEWKWDGIRAQLVHRKGEVFLWSRGEELIADRFPEIAEAGRQLPDGIVMDGEIVAFRDGRPLPFAALQRRIGRQRRVKEVAADVPVVFMAYDLLEDGGADIRQLPLRDRRSRLARMLADLKVRLYGGEGEAADLTVRLYRGEGVEADLQVRLSEELTATTWNALAALREESRAQHVEGLMLKRWTSPYRTGRRRGDWWKWKIEPHTIDAVLMYAQPGSGRRASLFTDLTFGVWDGDELVPVAKAYSGLTDEEIDELDRWIRRHTTGRFGPVSAVERVHVFELGFERIAPSTRHKSGVAVRFPRMLRWRRDKTPRDADTLDTLKTLIG